MNCAVILGTRPEIVKLGPVIRALGLHGLTHAVIHTGQHFSYEMDRVFFEQLGLPEPSVNLGCGQPGAGHGAQTGAMLAALETTVRDLAADRVVVHGDTNTTLAGALVAAKLNLPLGHVEAGLRSYDRTMPEEVNRVVADHVATQLYAPTPTALANLAAEGLTHGVFLTGNTIVDTISGLLDRLDRGATLARHGLRPHGYCFLTLHRQENTDDPERLGQIVEGLRRAAERTELPLVFSLHYRTKSRLEAAGLDRALAALPRLLLLHPPVDLLASLELQRHAALVITDSGGLQEEACILGTPCVTLRENTERPETLAIGCNVLAGFRPEGIVAAVERMLGRERGWPNPFGDGRAGLRCVAAISGRPDLDPGPLRAVPPTPGAEDRPWS